MRILFIASLILLLISHTLAFAHRQIDHLGKINFPTSGNKAAQPYFETGIRLLHSFEYEAARKQFLIAECIDPNFLLAYWGEAMTHNHSVWGEQNLIAGQKVLSKIAPDAKSRELKASTLKERGLIHAINLLYGKGDKKARDEAYSASMMTLYKKYPNDDEIASFYALALLGQGENTRDFKLYMQAGSIADDIYSRNPTHPGALHYAIHSFDDPIHAPLGLKAARIYAKIAPAASHALHMPSHIFMALGMWDEVIATNKSAWEAGLKNNPTQDPNKFTIDDLHAIRWLSYGYLQMRDFANAYKLTKQVENIASHAQSPLTKWYYALMRASYISESGEQSDLNSPDMRGMEISATATNLYANALIALKQKKPDIRQARFILMNLETLLKNARPQSNYKNYFISVTKGGILTAKITALILQAEILKKEGNHTQLSQVLQKATQLELQMNYSYGPPLPIKPTHELWGEILLEKKNYAFAYKNYLISLKRNPNRFLSARGLQQSQFHLEQTKQTLPETIKPYFNRLMLPEFHQ